MDNIVHTLWCSGKYVVSQLCNCKNYFVVLCFILASYNETLVRKPNQPDWWYCPCYFMPYRFYYCSAGCIAIFVSIDLRRTNVSTEMTVLVKFCDHIDVAIVTECPSYIATYAYLAHKQVDIINPISKTWHCKYYTMQLTQNIGTFGNS